MAMGKDRDDTAGSAERRVAEVVGKLMEFWGFKAVMGRMWGVLYLSPDPLSAAELGDRLAVSTGSISMAVTELQKWGVVKKTWRPGERRDYYEAETSIWKMVSRVFRERELVHIREAIAAFEEAQRETQAAMKRAAPDEKRRLKFVDGRLSSLLVLSRIGEGVLNMLLSGGPVNAPIVSLFEGKEQKDRE